MQSHNLSAARSYCFGHFCDVPRSISRRTDRKNWEKKEYVSKDRKFLNLSMGRTILKMAQRVLREEGCVNLL